MSNKNTQQIIQHAYRSMLALKDMKPRVGQRQMIAIIFKYLSSITTDSENYRTSEPRACAIEAGTGTGKTLSYLLAALPFCIENEKKLVVSTATVTLQEQLLLKDIPVLAENTNLSFKAVLAKGRGRYLCTLKLEQVMKSLKSTQSQDIVGGLPQPDKAEIAVYQALYQAWSEHQWNGDRDSWDETIDFTIWQQLSTDHRQCSNRRCRYFHQCPYFLARKEMEDAELVVANHDLVLTDLQSGGGNILPQPEETVYIFDEGHHLADKALQHFTHSCRLQQSLDWLEQMRQSMPPLRLVVDDHGMRNDLNNIPETLQVINTDLTSVKALTENDSWLEPLRNRLTKETQFRQNQDTLRFKQGIVDDQLLALADNLVRSLKIASSLLSDLHEYFRKRIEKTDDLNKQSEYEHYQQHIALLMNHAQDYLALWQDYAEADDTQKMPHARWIHWIDTANTQDTELCCSPLFAAGELAYSLWSRAFGVIMTSATLSSLGNFQRLKHQAGLPSESEYFQITSPFEYAKVSRLMIPNMRSDPGTPSEHNREIADCISKLIRDDLGHLALFTSWRQMNEVRDNMPSRLKNALLVQGDRPRNSLLEAHKARINQDKLSILFGLASFAEGVDLPGKYLTHVVIAKLPFSPPDAPLEAAQAEWIEFNGGNPFMQLSMPLASQKLVQAAGRLLRKETDFGRISMLDRRILSKFYGKQLLAALPPFKQEFNITLD